jgi:hypothetical protein
MFFEGEKASIQWRLGDFRQPFNFIIAIKQSFVIMTQRNLIKP